MSQAFDTRAADAVFPATPAQERLWLLERDHGDSISKNIAVQWELRGQFSDASVESAFQAVFDRHEILRTRFVDRDGGLRQEVLDHVPFRLGSIDLRGFPPADSQARIDGIARDMAAEPFDMAAPGQLRATLVRFEATRAMLLIATHYGVFDGYSIKILGREIGTLIAAAETGTSPDLPELALQYGDYAEWRAACAESGALDEARAFWHSKLEGKDYFDVPTDRPRRMGMERDGTTLKLPLPDTFRTNLDRAAKALGASPFALGAAVMAAALHAVTGRPDVGFTTCVAGREEVELEHLIGVFVNPVVLQFDCAGASVGDLIGAARRVVAEALGNGDYPIDDLADELGQPLDPGKTPFVAPFFSLQSVFVEEQEYGPLSIVSVPSHTPQATHDLAVQVIGRASGWHMIVDYDTALFDEATVRRFAEVVQAGFAAAFDRPDTPAHALTIPEPKKIAIGAAPANVSEPPSRPAQQPAPQPAPQLAPARAAPRTLACLSDIWHDTAGAAPAGPATDFFELGANSLAALRMLARVETDTGARIAIAEFFDDPTLGGLARKVDALLGTEPGPAEDAIWNVIALRPAPATAPLIVSINQPFLYHGLARSLEPQAEVINLHIRGTEALEGSDAEVLHRLVDTAAERIADRARGRKLVLIGHCVDGTLAYFTARRLTEMGQAPDLVAMIDSWRPDAVAGLSPAQRRLRRLGAKLRRWRTDLTQRLTGQIGWTDFLSRNKLTRPLLEALGRIDRPTETERKEWAVNARLIRLVKSIAPAPYAGEVALFSTGGQYRDARARLFGWTGTLPADTPIYDLPGWHEHALKTHGVKTVSAILACRLGRKA